MSAPIALRWLTTGVGIGLALGLLLGGPGAAASAPAPRSAGVCTPGMALNLSGAEGPAPWAVSFSLSDVWGPAGAVNWSFGDGSTFAGTGNGYLAPTHLYADPGSFDVSVGLVAGADHGTCQANVAVAPSPLGARIAATPSVGVYPLTVRFSAVISGGTGTFLSAVWQFGDGGSATGFNVSYTYEQAGQYTATFTAVDSANQSVHTAALVRVTTPDAVNNDSPHAPSVDSLLLAGAVLGAAIVLIASFGFSRWRRRRSPPADLSSEPLGPNEAAELGPEVAGPGGTGGSPSGIAPEPIEPPPGLLAPPEIVPASAAEPFEAPEGPEPATVPEIEAPEAAAPEEPRRPRLSQRLLVHLYLQGHLADGEVASSGFTQRGMAESLEVAQSPLSSVLRRLVVAGIVTQDTRHVHGQDRRLRVYRLTPLGETLAKDLYRARERAAAGSGNEPMRQV